MTIVELFDRLAAEGIHLAWFDQAGPVWTSPPPPPAKPTIDALAVELRNAWVAALPVGKGQAAWGQCDRCGLTALHRVPTAKAAAVPCWMTPRCKGTLARWATLPLVVQRWKTIHDGYQTVLRRLLTRLSEEQPELYTAWLIEALAQIDRDSAQPPSGG